MLTVVFVILGSLIVMVGVLIVLSPGKPKPILDARGKPVAGSISEKIFVEINGASQGMFIIGKDKNNPVLLYVHGGMPDYFLTERYPTGLEDQLTVCWWEQRGAGLSYRPDIDKKTLTVDQLISDTIAVTNYLRDRFAREKIYLMGHSGGTFIAIQAAARAPHLYHAYLGVSQVSNQLESERLAYEYMVSEYQKNGDARMVRRLMAAPVTLKDGVPKSYLSLRDVAMHRLGIGTTRDMKSVFAGIILRSFLCRQYTLREKINMWRAKAASGVSVVWDAMIATDLAVTVPQLDLPVYFLEAKYDYTCSYTEARTYFKKLKAPFKGFYTFKMSAHSPFLEEPARFNKIIQEDVLKARKELSDPI